MIELIKGKLLLEPKNKDLRTYVIINPNSDEYYSHTVIITNAPESEIISRFEHFKQMNYNDPYEQAFITLREDEYYLEELLNDEIVLVGNKYD